MEGHQKIGASGRLVRIALIPVLLALACNAPSRSDYATPSPTVTQTLPPQQATERAVRATADARSARLTATVSTQDAGSTAAAATLMSAPSSTQEPTVTAGTIRATYPPPIPGGTSVVGTPGVLIQSFAADAATINPGDAVTVRWQATGQTITLCTVSRGGPLGECESVPASGSHEFTTRDADRNYVMYILFAQSGDQQEQASVTVNLTCPVTWFFANPPDGCPQSGAALGPGAAERFEHGLMIWNQADDLITILYDDAIFSPKWDRSNDPWSEGMPQDDPGIVPPAGLTQPVRGFGMVWRGLGWVSGVRDRLGWATGPEFALSTAYQCDSAPKYNTCYLQGPDGVIVLEPERSAWYLYTGP